MLDNKGFAAAAAAAGMAGPEVALMMTVLGAEIWLGLRFYSLMGRLVEDDPDMLNGELYDWLYPKLRSLVDAGVIGEVVVDKLLAIYFMDLHTRKKAAKA